MITRRSFTKTLAASAALAALPLEAQTRLNIGVGTYSYHNLSIDDMIVQLKALRVAQIEMSRGEFMLFSKPEESLFRSTKEKLDRASIHCVSYYTATIKDRQDLDNAIGFAKAIGARNITGDATGSILGEIDQRCTKEGLTFGIHNHYFPGQKFPYESPDDVLKALASLSSTVGSTADVGQFTSCGYDPVDAVRKLGSRLKLVHLKDIQARDGEVNVLLGTGIAKIPEVMAELRRQKFAGLVAVEYEKEGRVEDDLRQEVEYARKLAG
ncbi:MAG TPA: sugar phosphate isomerase/epimerase [Terriglobales bacterium]|jgi:sugar phosphate isomerase/epimerase|nr:sugar phosphate isomerase/epimerase [Terriglobales bacterium]